MRNAAMLLGVIGGLVGMVVGFFAYGFAWLGEMFEDFSRAAFEVGVGEIVEDPLTSKLVGLFAPILAIAGGAMAPSRPFVAAVLLGLSSAGMFYAFDFNPFTMFPVGMCATAFLLALLGALLPPAKAQH